MVTIHIIHKRGFKTWFRKAWRSVIIHQNGNKLMWSAPQYNREDLEQMLNNLKRDLPKADIVYDTYEEE